MQVAWQRWLKRSVLASVRQLHGAHRTFQFPSPQIFGDRALKVPIRCDLPPIAERDIHLIAVANGATEACSKALNESIATMMMTNDTAEGAPFVIGNVGGVGPFVHVFTDLSLELVFRELDTVTDLVKYLRNRAALFHEPMRLHVRGEESLIPLYFRGYSDDTGDYDMRRTLPKGDKKPDWLAIDGDFWKDFVTRPEYQARRKANEASYLWDTVIEMFAQHQIDGTGSATRPPGLERDEGGLRYMALEPRVVRRGLSEQIIAAIDTFPDSADIAARSLLPGNRDAGTTAYLFMQLRPPRDMPYAQYRNARMNFLRIYTAALLHDRPELPRVVGIACEPARLVHDEATSEDMILIERSMVPPEALDAAKREKLSLGLSSSTSSGEWKAQEFPPPAT